MISCHADRVLIKKSISHNAQELYKNKSNQESIENL
jgi:hypothetical protein